MLTLQNLKTQWPSADGHNPGLLEGMANSAEEVFARYGVTSTLVVAHLMAQTSVESGQGTTLIENLKGYTVQELLRTFPKHFTTLALAQQAVGNEVLIGQIAYGGRLGNAPAPSTEGFLFRGAGLIQSTGKDGRVLLQKTLTAHNAGFDIVANPGMLIDPAHALECAVAFFAHTGCIGLAAKDCGDNVSRTVNGGDNGLVMRQQQLVLWKKELGVVDLATSGPCPPLSKLS